MRYFTRILPIGTCLLFLSLTDVLSGTIKSTASRILDYGGLSPEIQQKLTQKFRTSRLFKLQDLSAFQKPLSDEIQNFTLEMEKGNPVEMVLKPYEMRAPNYLIRVGNRRGVRVGSKSETQTYQAFSPNGDSKGRISFGNTSFSGYFKNNEETYFVEPLKAMDISASPEYLLIYTASDVIMENTSCGNEDGVGTTFLEEMDKASPAPGERPAVAGCMRTEIAFAVDNSMVRQYGGVQGAETRILEVMNAVEGLYQHEELNIKYSITEMYFEEEDMDTWGAQNDFYNNLPNLLNWARSSNGFSNSFDVSSMWFYERSGGVVGLAQLSSICSRSRGGNVVKDFSSNFMQVVVDQAHELGHNWSAPHINGSSYVMNPSIIRNEPQWSNETLELIKRHRDSRTCLSSCDVAPSAAFEVSQNECRSEVEFRDKSIDAPTEWHWDFGDGKVSTERNPVHNYKENGEYTVTLTTSNDFGEDEVTQENVVRIEAPTPPELVSIQCEGEKALVTARGEKELKWYSSESGGLPLNIGNQWSVNLPESSQTYYVEDADPDGQPQSVGPVDNSSGDGGYKDNGSIYMEFEIEKPIRFNSITVYSNEAGNRHFIMYYDGAVIADTVVNISTGQHEIEFNWNLLDIGEYRFELEQNDQYITNLYRNTEGVSYPQTVQGLIKVLRNYYHASDINSTGWYIGYNWQMQEVGACASPRLAVEITPECVVSVQRQPHELRLDRLNSLGKILEMEIRNLRGKLVSSLNGSLSADELISQLRHLPAGSPYFIKVKAESGQMQGMFQAQ